MPLTAPGLALAAAFVHALWNLVLARARDIEAATAVAPIIATALAGVFLKERVGWARMAGAVAVAAGIGLLSLG